MAVSPLRMSLLRGVNAMNKGVKNPFGQPVKLGPATNVPKPTRTPKSAPNLMIRNANVAPYKPKTGQAAQRQSENTQAKITGMPKNGFNNTAAGDKKYGLSGRSAPNIGPSDKVGYRKRSMVNAAKAAVENVKQKKLQIGGN